MKNEDDFVIERGRQLASACASGRDRVKDYQLGQVMAHLKRHKSVTATLQLVDELPGSPFAMRSNSARYQFKALARNIRTALAGTSDWQKAAAVVGWAKRLLKVSGMGQ